MSAIAVEDTTPSFFNFEEAKSRKLKSRFGIIRISLKATAEVVE
jgi:hypothetical protein